MGPFLTPIIMIIASGALLYTVTSGQYDEYKQLTAEIDQRVTTLGTFKEYIALRDNLISVAEKVSGSRAVEDRLSKMVPESIDTIRLNMDLYGIAGLYNIPLKDLAISVAAEDGQSVAPQPGSMDPSAVTAQTGITVQNKSERKTYNIKFGFTASYDKSMALLKDIEKSLRIIDIVNLDMTPAIVGGAGTKEKKSLQYNVTVLAKTYGLK